MQTILVVDDKVENTYLMQALLQGAGYGVQTAENGQAALALARENPPDLIISDILMPVMDGFNFCREAKRDPQLAGVPFMFYTATYTDVQDETFALKQGADLFLVKPAEPEMILKSARALLDRAAACAARRASCSQPEPVYLKEHNEVLVRKLVHKVEELEQRNLDLEKKEQMKSHFLTVAAHELHTPLACLLGYAELLQQQSASGLAAGVCRSAERLASVSRMIIDMSRAEAAELPLRQIAVELNALVAERLTGLREFITHRKQTLSCQPAGEQLTVTGDPDELGQAFVNLVLNAIRFTPDGGQITVSTALAADGCAISVADNGIGIPVEEQERIFERFYQLKNISTHHSGTIEFMSGGLGLGLSIARAIVEKHGGSIRVQSVVDKGTTFTMRLPKAGQP